MDDYKTKEELFDAICRAEFSRYIKNKCETYPSKEELDAMYSVPKRGRRRLMRAIKAEQYGKPLFVVYLQRVAILLLVTITVAFGVLMTNTEVRAEIGNVIIEWCEKYIKFDFNGGKETIVEIDDTEGSSDTSDQSFESNPIYDYEIGYIPEGFDLENSKERGYTRNYIYYDAIDNCVGISINDSNHSTYSVDIENNEYTEIIINGKKAYCLYDDSVGSGSIIANEAEYIIYVYGTVSKEELIKIFENINN